MEHVDSLADHLERRGHEVGVLAPNDPLDFRTRLLHPKLGRHGPLQQRMMPVGRSIPLPSNGSLGNLAFSPTVFRAVRKAIRSQRPDVVHVHEPLLPLVSWAAVGAAREMDIPIAGTFHANYPKGCIHYSLFEPVLTPYFRSLDAAIAVSPTAVRTVARYFPGEYRIVPNGVDVGRFHPSGSARNPHQILFVGRSVTRKGLPVLLAALPAVLKRVPEARLVVVGGGYENIRVPKALLSSVEFRGTVDEASLVSNMQGSSVLCAPSTGGESFGIVLIEAMAAGLPVVASDIPGYGAVVNSGENGLLVPPGDPGALSRALVDMLTDPARRAAFAEAGQEFALRYDWSRIAAVLEGVYTSLLETRRAGKLSGEGPPSYVEAGLGPSAT